VKRRKRERLLYHLSKTLQAPGGIFRFGGKKKKKGRKSPSAVEGKENRSHIILGGRKKGSVPEVPEMRHYDNKI